MRAAVKEDLEGIADLLAPLEQKGILKPRSREQLKAELPHYTVIEREVPIRCQQKNKRKEKSRAELPFYTVIKR